MLCVTVSRIMLCFVAAFVSTSEFECFCLNICPPMIISYLSFLIFTNRTSILCSRAVGYIAHFPLNVYSPWWAFCFVCSFGGQTLTKDANSTTINSSIRFAMFVLFIFFPQSTWNVIIIIILMMMMITVINVIILLPSLRGNPLSYQTMLINFSSFSCIRPHSIIR